MNNYIQLGKINKLQVIKDTPYGLILNSTQNEEVLLLIDTTKIKFQKYLTTNLKIGKYISSQKLYNKNFVDDVWNMVDNLIDKDTIIMDTSCGYGNFLKNNSVLHHPSDTVIFTLNRTLFYAARKMIYILSMKKYYTILTFFFPNVI